MWIETDSSFLASQQLPLRLSLDRREGHTQPRLVSRHGGCNTWIQLADANAEEQDVVIIGGGVAGYVAAIKAGQEGMKVRKSTLRR